MISFLNQKGGVGKTTMCFNSAHALLAQTGAKVLCLDMDPQANLSLLFNKEVNEEDHSIYHLLINSIRELKNIHTSTHLGEIIHHHESGIDLLPQELSGFELTVSGINTSRPLILKNYFKRVDYSSIRLHHCRLPSDASLFSCKHPLCN